MAIELITGRAGAPHVDSADVGAFNAAMFGGGVYVVEGCEATLTDANHVRVSAGELLCEGRHVRITGSGETLAIDNGLSGYNRNDIVAMRYERNSSDIETCSLVVVKGSQDTGAAQDPTMPSSGKLLDGASSVYWPLYRIPIVGLTPQTPVRLAGENPVITAGADATAKLGIDDYVVSHGMTKGWTWAKYASGMATCSRNMSLSGYTTSQWGTWRYTSVANSNFPFAFVDVPAVLATSRHIAYVAALTDTTTTNPGGIYFYTQQNATYTDTINASIYAVGRWK